LKIFQIKQSLKGGQSWFLLAWLDPNVKSQDVVVSGANKELLVEKATWWIVGLV
jgi:hypothetical protein